MSFVASLQRTYLRFHAALYVRSRGRIGHRLAGVPSLILWTVGRRSGRVRPAVLIYARDDDAFAVVASNHGFDRPPAWLMNIREQPAVGVQVGRRQAQGRAQVVGVGDPDYARLWTLVNDNNHQRYAGYQSRTPRPIPIVLVTPTGPLRSRPDRSSALQGKRLGRRIRKPSCPARARRTLEQLTLDR